MAFIMPAGARSTRQMYAESRSSGGDLGERGVAQQEALFPDGERHLRYGLVPGTFDGEHRTVAEAGVVDLVPHTDGDDLLLRLDAVLGDGRRDVRAEACSRVRPGAAGRAGAPEGPAVAAGSDGTAPQPPLWRAAPSRFHSTSSAGISSMNWLAGLYWLWPHMLRTSERVR